MKYLPPGYHSTLPAFAFSQLVCMPIRIVSRVNDGVYVIRHSDAPDGNPQGNTTVIIGEKKVIVVDSCYLPSSAREDIDLVKRLTDKPVDYLINTNWHADHQQGNAEYVNAFPQVTIIAHEETASEMARFETKDYKPCYPNLTLTGDLNLDIGNELVRVLYLGLVHTKGDIMILLPRKKFLITGDIVGSPIPYFIGGGYPYSGLKILETINQMDLNVIVPGHGELLTDKVYLRKVIDLLKNVIRLVEAEVHREGFPDIKLENVQNAINLSSYRQEFAKSITENEYFFDESIGKGLVEGCFNEMAK
jgi:glyoxylase-like metal-dependent hydrolase (beta-lactamase superfamily II)